MHSSYLKGSVTCLTAYFLADTLSARLSGAIFLMAKASQIARAAKKVKLSQKYAAKRAELLAAGDYEGLQKLPKNASPVRVKNRCAISGRSRGYMRDFGVSRIVFRELARDGKIPGVKKASW
jgi:small subunit ribosomal protein S14